MRALGWGEFLFSPATVDRLDDDYELIKHLPHKPGGWVGIYSFYTEISGTIIPNKLVWLLPNWAQTRYANHPLWKWILAVLLLSIFIWLLVLIRRLGPGGAEHSHLRRALRRILFPFSLMLTAFLLDYLQKDIGFRGDISENMTTVLLGVTFLGAGWTVHLIGSIHC